MPLGEISCTHSFIHKSVMGQKPLLGFGVTEVTAYNPVGEIGIKRKICHQLMILAIKENTVIGMIELQFIGA